jgi:hypothetical protein
MPKKSLADRFAPAWMKNIRSRAVGNSAEQLKKFASDTVAKAKDQVGFPKPPPITQNMPKESEAPVVADVSEAPTQEEVATQRQEAHKKYGEMYAGKTVDNPHKNVEKGGDTPAENYEKIVNKIKEIRKKPKGERFVKVERELIKNEFSNVQLEDSERFEMVPAELLSEYYDALQLLHDEKGLPQSTQRKHEVDNAIDKGIADLSNEDKENIAKSITEPLREDADKAKKRHPGLGQHGLHLGELKERYPELLNDEPQAEEPQNEENYEVTVDNEALQPIPEKVVLDKTEEPDATEKAEEAEEKKEPVTQEETWLAGEDYELNFELEDDDPEPDSPKPPDPPTSGKPETPPARKTSADLDWPEKGPLDIEFGDDGDIKDMTDNVKVVEEGHELQFSATETTDTEIIHDVVTDNITATEEELTQEDIPFVAGETREEKKNTNAYTYQEATSKSGDPKYHTHTEYVPKEDIPKAEVEHRDTVPPEYDADTHNKDLPPIEVSEEDKEVDYGVEVEDTSLSAEMKKGSISPEAVKKASEFLNEQERQGKIDPKEDPTPYKIPEPEYVGGHGIDAEEISAKEAGRLMAESKQKSAAAQPSEEVEVAQSEQVVQPEVTERANPEAYADHQFETPDRHIGSMETVSEEELTPKEREAFGMEEEPISGQELIDDIRAELDRGKQDPQGLFDALDEMNSRIDEGDKPASKEKLDALAAKFDKGR